MMMWQCLQGFKSNFSLGFILGVLAQISIVYNILNKNLTGAAQSQEWNSKGQTLVVGGLQKNPQFYHIVNVCYVWQSYFLFQ